MAKDENINTHQQMAKDDNIDTHQQMPINDNIDTHPAKKMKLQEEEIPKSQGDAIKMKLEEDIPKSQDGTDNVHFRDPGRKVRCIVLVNFKNVIENRACGGDSLSLFRNVMKAAGCSVSEIEEKGRTSGSFVAYLTPEEAKKLSDLDSVRGVKEDAVFNVDTRRF